MPSLFTTALAAFGLAVGLTLVARFLLRRWPPPPRRHTAPTTNAIPRLGGVAVAAAAALALLGTRWAGWRAVGTGVTTYPWFGPVLLVLLIGAADDWWDLRPRWKFAGQAIAAAWAMAAGLRVGHLFHYPLPVGLSVALTLVWLVGCCNAFNLIDGLDGLAAGLALFATGTVLAHAVLIGEPGLALAMGAVFGALAGFLVFNFPPASIYLGDSGSLAIGFFLGCMALTWANKATTAVGLLAPLFALAIPLADTVLAMLRRLLTGQPVFAGDRRHVHHRLLKRGFSPRNAVLVLYGAGALGAAAALVLADVRQRQTFELVILLFVAMAAVGMYELGYVELLQAGQVLRRNVQGRRRGLQAKVILQTCAQELAAAADYEQVWASLEASCRSLALEGMSLQTATWSRATGAEPGPRFRGWTCQLPLGEDGELGTVRFWCALGPTGPGFLDDLAAAMGSALAPRLSQLGPRAAKARATAAGT